MCHSSAAMLQPVIETEEAVGDEHHRHRPDERIGQD
jgi:hypothetical protein